LTVRYLFLSPPLSALCVAASPTSAVSIHLSRGPSPSWMPLREANGNVKVSVWDLKNDWRWLRSPDHPHPWPSNFPLFWYLASLFVSMDCSSFLSLRTIFPRFSLQRHRCLTLVRDYAVSRRASFCHWACSPQFFYLLGFLKSCIITLHRMADSIQLSINLSMLS